MENIRIFGSVESGSVFCGTDSDFDSVLFQIPQIPGRCRNSSGIFLCLILMGYDIAPKKTLYNGILYRSRLEAQWQAFFDFIGIKAEYEPHYVDTIDWLPDFEIVCDKQFLVEVKPLAHWDDELMKKLAINAKLNNVLLLHENVYPELKDHMLYIGKFVTGNGDLKLLDFGLNSKYYEPVYVMYNLWKEAKNKTAYYGRMD